MELTWLQPLVSAPGPLASVHVDVTRAEATAEHQVELRWSALRHQLEDAGAPDAAVSAVAERVLASTGLGGEHGRSVFAGEDGVLLDRVVPVRPTRDAASWGTVPHLMPLVRGLSSVEPYVLVEVDHAGAHVTVADGLGHGTGDHAVEGGHDVLHKVPGGGLSQRRYQARVEDSWERNAEAVARDVDSVVGQHHPRVVVLAGDPRARGEVRAHASERLAPLLVDVEGGGRADGLDEDVFHRRVEEVLQTVRQSAMGDVVARYSEAHGRGGLAAAGLEAVVGALRTGAVEVLLLHDDSSSTDRLWAGTEPLQLGVTADDVTGLGAQDLVEDRADAVLLRALVAQGGSVELVEGVDVLTGGVGAVLRYDIRPTAPRADG